MIDIQWLELTPDDGGILLRQPNSLQLQSPATVQQALEAIGIAPERIQTMLAERAVAVFGLYATAGTQLHEGDRIEILDGLKFDPMESRRRRARHKMITKRQKELARHERRSRKQGKAPL